MKFQYTEHKAKWDRIIKHLEKGVKQYEELSDLDGIIFPYYSQLIDFACAYADMQWANSGFNSFRCSFCPLEFKNNRCPNVAIPYDEGAKASCIKTLKLSRDVTIKKGVDFD